MLAVPPAFLDQLHLEAGTEVGLAVEGESLIVSPKQRKRYTMAEILAKSDYTVEQPASEREWIDAPAVGRELI